MAASGATLVAVSQLAPADSHYNVTKFKVDKFQNKLIINISTFLFWRLLKSFSLKFSSIYSFHLLLLNILLIISQRCLV